MFTGILAMDMPPFLAELAVFWLITVVNSLINQLKYIDKIINVTNKFEEIISDINCCSLVILFGKIAEYF